MRYLIAALVVVIYWGIGYSLRLSVVEYQLAGIPILLAFQLAIQRDSLLALWVRAAPPMRIDALFVVFWILFSIVPAYDLIQTAMKRDPASALFYGAGIVGAFGLAYALKAFRPGNGRQLGLCVLTAGGIGILPSLLAVVLPAVLHIHMRGPAGAASNLPFAARLASAAGTFLLLPVGFVVEEVFFRGALDTYLHRGEPGAGWLSAIYVSALWGLWHLPADAIHSGRLVSAAAGLIVAQVLIGVPLSIWWRKSGNLTVTATTHALLDAARILLAA